MAEHAIPSTEPDPTATTVPGARLRARGVRLRPVEEHDLPTLCSWVLDPAEVHLWRSAAGLPVRTRFYDELHQRLARDLQHMVAEREADRSLVGWFSAYGYATSGQSCEITFYVPPGTARRTGEGPIGGLLFVEYLYFGLTLPIRRISATVFAYNERSQRQLAKIGFVREGTIRQAHYFDGRYHDVHLYGQLRGEWEAARDRLRFGRLLGGSGGPSA